MPRLPAGLRSPEAARAFLEAARWPRRVVCPHCGSVRAAFRLQPKPGAATHVRRGVWKCAACRCQFTVTVGTIFEHSRLPLNKWLQAIDLLCSSRAGSTPRQLQEALAVTYKTAGLIATRIRYALAQKAFSRIHRPWRSRPVALSLFPLPFQTAVTELLKVTPAHRRDPLEVLDEMGKRAPL